MWRSLILLALLMLPQAAYAEVAPDPSTSTSSARRGDDPQAARAEVAPDPGLEAMRALPALVGRWEGGGWMRQGPGEPIRFVGEERVESRLDGRVVIVEGRHFSLDRARVVHHALAVLSYDGQAKRYRFSTHLDSGHAGDFPAHMEEGALVWEMDSPIGKMRYVVRIEGDGWHEVGEIQREGQWQQFFAMDLKRTEP